jgi:hypothetical protein
LVAILEFERWFEGDLPMSFLGVLYFVFQILEMVVKRGREYYQLQAAYVIGILAPRGLFLLY